MSDNFIQQVTMDCLVNKDFYNRHLEKQTEKTISRADKKFYRKRLHSLAKDLLLSKEDNLPHLFPDVKHAFDHFVNTCIHYFKTVDNNDIIQSDYQNISESLQIGSNIPELNIDDIQSQEEANKLLMRTIQMTNTLDKFIKRKRVGPPETLILPKQKDINLKDPSLKLKGVTNSDKKKNIDNKYEGSNTKETTKKDKEETNAKETQNPNM